MNLLDELPEDLAVHWDKMHANKGDLERRCEQYAKWTIPYICPEDGQEHSEVVKGNVAIGSRLVNSLANRIVDVMFPSDRPFFSLPLSAEARRELEREHRGDKDAVGKAELAIKLVTAQVVDDAIQHLDLTRYRPVAVEAVKHSIVTGGCIMLRHEDGQRTVYGIKDYAAHRDMRGRLVRVVLRDSKTFATLSTEYQNLLRENAKRDYSDDSEITLYTYFERTSEDRWISVQGLDDEIVPYTEQTFDNVNLPVVDIHWNLSRGDHYPRGAVEDNSVLFHNIDVVTLALLDLIGIMTDIKFLVDPASSVDVAELNRATRGSYHPGRKDDINAVEFKHRAELQLLADQVQLWERQLAQAFLMMSAVTRDAERVTAEEIRAQARELETAFGGLYSKLALSWQKREAEMLLREIDTDASEFSELDVVVSTGMESLTREGQLDALRLALSDMQMLDTVPEDVRVALDQRAFMEFVFTNRGVNFGQFLKSKQQIADEQQAAQDREQEMIQAQGAQAAAAKAAGSVQ